jgi:hypothetical protein
VAPINTTPTASTGDNIMQKLVKFVLPLAFVAASGVGLAGCEQKKEAAKPASAPSTPEKK